MPITDIKDIVPRAIQTLQESNSCLTYFCGTCASRPFESAFINALDSYIAEHEELELTGDDHGSVMEEALCKMDMNAVKQFTKKDPSHKFGGPLLPWWVKVLKGLTRNDINSDKWSNETWMKVTLIRFKLDFTKIYAYWMEHRLDEPELLDFIIFYDDFVPEDKKDYIMSVGKSLLKQNYNQSLEETINYIMGLV